LGTPAVGYDIPGLRDSIIDGLNGLLTKPSVKALAEALIEILNDDDLRLRLSLHALRISKRFSWDRSAEEFEEIAESVCKR